jgi:hypothetical protein
MKILFLSGLMLFLGLAGSIAAWHGEQAAADARQTAARLRVELQTLRAARDAEDAANAARWKTLLAQDAPPERADLLRQLEEAEQRIAITRLTAKWKTEAPMEGDGPLAVETLALSLDLAHEGELLALLEALAHPSMRVHACDVQRPPDTLPEPRENGPNLIAECQLQWIPSSHPNPGPADGNSADGAFSLLGRLFFTPEIRARLEARKHAPVRDVEEIGTPPHYHGWLQRQGGEAVVWIDGKPETGAGGKRDWPDLLNGGHLRVERHR